MGQRLANQHLGGFAILLGQPPLSTINLGRTFIRCFVVVGGQCFIVVVVVGGQYVINVGGQCFVVVVVVGGQCFVVVVDVGGQCFIVARG
jgi:hypothetical protein